MSKAREFYDKSKRKDGFTGLDIVNPNVVETLIEIAKLEGMILGLQIAKKAYADNIFQSVCEQEEYCKEQLEELLSDN